MKRFLQNWLPALLLTALVTGAATASDGPNLMRRNVVSRSGDTMTGTLNNSVASGSNGFACTTDGCRFDIGTGTNDYFVSDGTNIEYPGNLDLTGSTGTITWTGSGRTLRDDGSALASNNTFQSEISSGNNGFHCATNGCRFDFGAGASDYASSDGTTVTFAGPLVATAVRASTDNSVSMGNSSTSVGIYFGFGEIASTSCSSTESPNGTHTSIAYDGTMQAHVFCQNGNQRRPLMQETASQTMFVTYVNNTIAALTYGGFTAPARDFQVSAVRFRIRTAGSGGSSNATIRISDGVSNCDCAFACNTAAGNQRVACSDDTACDFEASDSMTVSVSGVGDCTVTTDILGNIEFETLWE